MKKETPVFTAKLTNNWKLGHNSFIILADVKQATYGILAEKNLQNTFPDWVILMLEDNYLKPHFRGKKYYEGLDETTDMITGLIAGTKTTDDLKRDSSGGSLVIILIVAVIFFLLIFPILQFRAMRRSHFSRKPMDFVSTVLLMNNMNTAGSQIFDNFSQSKGKFS